MPKHLEPDWEGGSWERPSARYIPSDIIDGDLAREVVLTRRFRRVRRYALRGAIALGVLAIVTTGAFALINAINPYLTQGNITIPPNILEPWGGYDSYEQSDELIEPSMKRADILDAPILELEMDAGQLLTPQQNYQQNLESIVFISSAGNESSGTGTGIVLTEDGYIVTNAHVVSDGYMASVTLSDESVYQAELVGWDGDEDLAVLKIDAEGLIPATFGNSDDVQVGDLAYAMGNPLGAEYRSTFSDGMISSASRYLDIDGVKMSFIQTTAAINMGNSGGALLNESGQVIGVTTIKMMSDTDTIEGMGFAIPSARVQRVVNCLVQGIAIETPALGITIIPTNEPVRGLLIDEVKANSPAAAAGLKAGDVLIEAEGTPLYTNDDMARIKDQLLVGDTIHVVCYRDGEEIETSVVLVEFDTVHE